MFTASNSAKAVLIISLAFNEVNAQVTTRRRTSSVGRIVAGVVVGCLVLIALLVLCCVMTRRRRRMRNNPSIGYTAGSNNGFYGTGGRPLFGAGGMFPFGQQKQNYNQDTTFPPQQPGGAQYGYGNNDPNAYAAQPVGGGGYQPSSQPPALPTYGKEGAGYAPPPGPPPPAHTTDGQNDHFVGGFRS
ncbi:hypothetical protein J3R30DRAFT_3501589 [Lentinula aciculospora]|uniref:Uncharacterized protein n=1 Tax=Lentinula aciculospora TaxID=153920 RepID=A0A9W9A6J0_9AGAR|nr:hypothetical protein J3R30DRAFT_3501589 [Lentinula aciculospora]